MSNTSPTHRGDLMRRIAALHVEIDKAQTVAKRLELQQKIALTKQLMIV